MNSNFSCSRAVYTFLKHPQHFQLTTLVQKRALDESNPLATIQLSEDVERHLTQRDALLRKPPNVNHEKKTTAGAKDGNATNKVRFSSWSFT